MNAQALNAIRENARPGWMAPIASQLDLVERKLEATVTSEAQPAFEMAIHLFSAGGKRIRPALVLLSACAAGAEAGDPRAINLAASTELVHMASLVHDDVVDETSERRGVATANAKWGNKLSVLGGDFLLSKSFTLLAADGDFDVLRVLSSMAVGMTESEVLQASSDGSIAAWEENYWQIIRGKTAEFMGACCECGAIVAGADERVRAAMIEYGLQLGFAFQITDDILDIEGNPARTGKPVGTDLIHGKFTLPVLLALQSFDSEARRTFLASVNSGSMSADSVREVVQQVIASGAVEMARERALRFAEQAMEQLKAIPTSPYSDALEMLAESVIGRKA
ncbi:MAG: polyprenyl synthetase family protein [Armatimonadetes bacterium]|nr:polyprenyl synthetase family protein [Armatimonadota bacterium]